MTKTMRMDAFTARLLTHALRDRRRTPGDVAALLMDTAAAKVQVRRDGMSCSIRSWRAMGSLPIVPGDDAGGMRMRVEVKRRDAGGSLDLDGYLHRDVRGLALRLDEMAIDARSRVLRANKGEMRVRVEQKLPDAMRAALPTLAGKPLAFLVGHPAIEGADDIRIVHVATEGGAGAASRVGLPGDIAEDGFDVLFAAPEVDVEFERRGEPA